MAPEQERLVGLARDGDAEALATLVRSIQDRVFRLSVRMLADHEAAQDAAQEILIRVVTKLSTFNGDSRFETWATRIAVNYLLTARRVIEQDPELSFELFGRDLLDGLVDEDQATPEDDAMLNDLRIRCTMAMLLCLDRKHRAAYILGEVLELDHVEAADVLEIGPAAFRKQLSRSRAKVQQFAASNCGLVSRSAPCSCPRRLPAARSCGRLGGGGQSQFADAPSYAEAKDMAHALNAALAAVKLQRATGSLNAPGDMAVDVLSIVNPPG